MNKKIIIIIASLLIIIYGSIGAMSVSMEPSMEPSMDHRMNDYDKRLVQRAARKRSAQNIAIVRLVERLIDGVKTGQIDPFYLTNFYLGNEEYFNALNWAIEIGDDRLFED